MNILLLGSKEYPFGSSIGYDKKPSGGIEIHVEKLAEHLAKRGNSVFIVTRLFPGQKKTEKKGNITVYRVRFIYNKLLRTFTFNALGFAKARKTIKENNIQVIHCHGPVAGFFGGLLSRTTGVPMVFTPHGTVTTWRTPIKEVLQTFEAQSMKAAKKAVFISPKEKELLKGNNVPYALLANAVDAEKFRPSKRTWKETRFLFLGRLEEVKGIKYMLEAFARLAKKDGDPVLYIAGDGALRGYIEDFISKNRLIKRIKFLGWADSREWLGKTDVFLLPSWEKGQPMALLEAMAASKVIITSLDYIKHGITGIKVKPRDAEDLCKKMLQVSKGLEKARRLGVNARKEALKSYAWENLVGKIEKVYAEVAKTAK